MMGVVNSGFGGGPRASDRLPPGQTLAEDWPVLTAGPTPDIAESEWSFTITTEDGVEHRWDWAALLEVGVEDIVTDIHCVTHWSKLDMAWRGVPVESLFEDVDTAYDYVMVECYGGYTTNLSLDDLFDDQAMPCQPGFEPGTEIPLDQVGDLAREDHVEAVVPDEPGHRLLRG